MYVIPAFFFLMELIFLFHYRKIYYYHQWLPNLWRKRTQGVRLIILSRDIILYLFLSLVRMLYLLYAIYIVLFTLIGSRAACCFFKCHAPACRGLSH